MNDTITEAKLITFVKSTDDTRRYLAHIRRRINAAKSERERAGYAIIALALEAELKESK